jgi:transposase
MVKKLWAGLDIGVETTSICVVDEAGTITHEATCPTNLKEVHREIGFLRRRRFARVGLETGPGMHLARGLRSLGYSVDIYEARRLSKFLRIRRNKTDAGDANGIAEAGRLAAPLVSKVYLKSFEVQALASRLRIRRHLVRARTAAQSLLFRQLELFGGRIHHRVRSAHLHDEVEAQIKLLFGGSPSPIASDLRGLLRHCEDLLGRLTTLDRDLTRLALSIDICRRMMDIPGVGPICALTFYAAIEEPHRFRKSADVGSYLGLTPKLFQSGLSMRFGKISKMGNREARALLVQAALRFMMCADHNSTLRHWTNGIEQRRGRGKSRIALARKLATIMVAIWKNGQVFQQKVEPALFEGPDPVVINAAMKA